MSARFQLAARLSKQNVRHQNVVYGVYLGDNRWKVGRTTSLHSRLCQYRCVVPQADAVWAMFAPKEIESYFHNELDRFLIHGEVFQLGTIEAGSSELNRVANTTGLEISRREDERDAKISLGAELRDAHYLAAHVEGRVKCFIGCEGL